MKGHAKRRTIAQVVASLMELGRPDAAWQTAVDQLANSGAKGDDRYPGSLMKELGAWQWARDLYIRSYSESPNSHLAYMIGFAFTRLFEWSEAVEWFRAAIPGHPDALKIRYYLGLALEREESWLEASIDYLKAAQTGSARDYRVYRALHCMSQAGETEAAALALAGLTWLSPSPRTFEDLDVAQSALETRLASSLAVAKKSQRTSTMEFVVREAIDAGFWDLAVEAGIALVDRDPTHRMDNFLLLGRAFEGAGMTGPAVDAILKSRIYREPSIVDHVSYEKNRGVRNAMRFGAFQRWWSIDESSILYESNHGGKLTCNVLPMVLEMVDDPRFEHFNHYVVLPNRSYLPPALQDRPDVIVVPRESDLYLRKLATSSYLINNNTFPSYFSRQDGQQYLNTWHGTPIKSMGREIRNGNFDYRNAARNFLQVTHFALPNSHTRDQLLNQYNISNLFQGHVELTGSPRMDTTLNMQHSTREAVRNRLGVEQGQKAVLFAPTWRGELGNVVSDFDTELSVLALIEAEGFCALYRGHPVALGGRAESEEPVVHTVPDDIDTNVLLGCVDAVISDYSSIAFDAAAAGLPVALYAHDEELYAAQRGFSLDIHEIGMPVLTDVGEVSTWLKQLHASGSGNVDDVYFRHEDGGATERVIDFLLEPRPETRCEPSPNNVLLFEGHFIPNGITSAAGELNKVLAETHLNPIVAVEPSAITPFAERSGSFSEATEMVAVIPRIAGSTDNAEQRWLIARQHQGHSMTRRQLDAIHEAYKAEFHRLFGYSQFRAAIGFEGFSLYWSNLFAAATADRKVGYLHADMYGEASSRFPYLWKVFDTYQYFDALACVSADALEQNRKNLTAWTRPGQFLVAENLIDIHRILDEAKAEVEHDFAQFCAAHRSTFVAVGRISIEKGSDRLIDGFLQVAQMNPDVGLVVIGDGPLRMELERKIQLAGFEDRVFFTGLLASPFAHMRHCDNLVLASHHEGQGIVILEGLVLDLRIMSVDIPGPRSILADGAGLLVENSMEGLVRGFLDLINGYEPSDKFDAWGYVEKARKHALNAILGVGGEPVELAYDTSNAEGAQ
ncbi:CDP-glycerol glycerophosphotransferase [Brevibacterium casei CIP 102111]|uniref:CDP-glycerol glycerophosphotransferase n=2 Tax=Brevibacterium casei TaxID=33889 RepID=A0A2H1JKV1_9MICO|nr:CDP-glycerol glycerophosphotransferase [Brevibacterium casei CIP 102111]